ncbi:MAG: hypothetical protein ACYDHD_07715 [Vulcanimicrobiaceae bacterium]
MNLHLEHAKNGRTVIVALLEMRDAEFAAPDGRRCGPISMSLERGMRQACLCRDAWEARAIARLASGVIKTSHGFVLIGDFDPRLQPTQCKRIAAYVAHDAMPLDGMPFERFIAYRAALWDLDLDAALTRSRMLLAQLEGLHEAFAVPLVAALLAQPRLLVLDRPQAVYARAILAAASDCAVFSTHDLPRDIDAFDECAAQRAPAR